MKCLSIEIFCSLQQFILLLDISAKAYLIQLYKQLVYKTFFQLLISEQLTTGWYCRRRSIKMFFAFKNKNY